MGSQTQVCWKVLRVSWGMLGGMWMTANGALYVIPSLDMRICLEVLAQHEEQMAQKSQAAWRSPAPAMGVLKDGDNKEYV